MFVWYLKQFKLYFLLVLTAFVLLFVFLYSNNRNIGAEDTRAENVKADSVITERKGKIKAAINVTESKIDEKTGKDIINEKMVYYLYVTEKKVEDLKDEIVEKRGYNYRVFKRGDKEEYQFHGTAKYEKINNEWKQIEWATSTKEVYEKSLDINIISHIKNWLFAGTVFADTFYPVTNGDNSEHNSNANWSTLRDSTSSGTARNGNTCYIQNYYNGTNYLMERAQLAFDTSGLADDCSKNSGKLELHGDWRRNTTPTNTFSYSIYTYTGADTTPDADEFGKADYTSYSGTSIKMEDWDTSAGRNNSFTLNSTGLSNVSVTGNSFFAVYGNFDAANSAPTGTDLDGIGFGSVRTTGTSDDPLLTITCDAPAPATEERILHHPQMLIY